MSGSALLVLDTATDRTTLALRAAPGRPIRDGSASGPERGAAALGVRLAALLEDAQLRPADLAAVGVGTGPGGFTGLRVGLATAKTLAWSLGIPLVGVPTVDALRRAAAPTGTDPASLAVVQAAGARDHYLTLPGEAPCIVPPGTDLVAAAQGHPVVALGTDASRLVGCQGPDGLDPSVAGERARACLGEALVALVEERLAAGRADDPGSLVPVYVALPRGIAVGIGAGWTPDIR